MRISEHGIQTIKNFEGLSLKAYRCPAGVWTIGWGSTAGVTAGMTITLAQAEDMLRAEVERFEKAVNRLVEVPLSQNQFDALVSFAYNVGDGALARSTLLRLLNQGDYDAVPGQLARWTHGGGRVLPGLVKRRRMEGELWMSPAAQIYEIEEPMAQDVTEEPVGSNVMLEMIIGLARHLVTGAGGLTAASSGGDASAPATWLGLAIFVAGVAMSVFDKIKREGDASILNIVRESIDAIHDRLDEKDGPKA